MTAPTEDLIARLEERWSGSGFLLNPDGPAAATAIRALQQEVERKDRALSDCERLAECVAKEMTDDDAPPVILLENGERIEGELAELFWEIFAAFRHSGQIARSALTGSAQG